MKVLLPAPAGSCRVLTTGQSERSVDESIVQNVGKDKGGLAKVLMGPEKGVSLRRKPGEGSWNGMIGQQEVLDYASMQIVVPKRPA